MHCIIYVGMGSTFDIEVVTDSVNGMKYLKARDLRLEIFRNEFDGSLYDKNVLRAHNLDGSACRWLDDGEDQELVYFLFENGESNHATNVLFMGNVYNYTSKFSA